MSESDEFTMWVSQQPRGPGQLGLRGAMLKNGRQVAKTVTVAEYGDQATGEIRKRELRFKTIPRDTRGPGYDFEHPTSTWACEDDEVERLTAFLGAEVAQTGRYRVLDMQSPQADLIEQLLDADKNVATKVIDALISRGAGAAAAVIQQSEGGLAVAERAVIEGRRDLIERLARMAASPGTTETDMQREMGSAYWLFGGRYARVAPRRNLAPLDQHDIPLVMADGTLHIIELKGPDIPRLVQRHRNHYVVGSPVHEAVSQAMNYLRTLDEQGSGLRTAFQDDFGEAYDFRRVFATVVIGHPSHVRADAGQIERRQIEQTLRTYNSHLARVEVITYAELLDAARRTLDFNAELNEEASERNGTDGVEAMLPNGPAPAVATAPDDPPGPPDAPF